MNEASLVVSDGAGNIFDVPSHSMIGMGLGSIVELDQKDLIPLPEGSDLFELPGRNALAKNRYNSSIEVVSHYNGNRVYPVAAFMAPAFIQFARTAYHTDKKAPRLPLFSYTAVGWMDDMFYVAGKRIDSDVRQDLCHFKHDRLQSAAEKMVRAFPNNRLVEHLVYNCVFQYGCPAARNFVLERWECPVPTSPGCNAHCAGCLSLQKRESGFEASMRRISFVPTVSEIVEFCTPHLEQAPRAIISFGQGCEGEPLLQTDLIEESLIAIRKRTKRGIININTNASRPDCVERLLKAGLDSVRISLNSAQPEFYTRYFQPQDYSFESVMESLKIVSQYKAWLSLNYFIVPGFTDSSAEMKALDLLLKSTSINMIQTRNLNCDPEYYVQILGLESEQNEGIGIRQWLKYFSRLYPRLKLGYFNPPQEEMRKFRVKKGENKEFY